MKQIDIEKLKSMPEAERDIYIRAFIANQCPLRQFRLTSGKSVCMQKLTVAGGKAAVTECGPEQAFACGRVPYSGAGRVLKGAKQGIAQHGGTISVVLHDKLEAVLDADMRPPMRSDRLPGMDMRRTLQRVSHMIGLRQFRSWSCLREVLAIAGVACLLMSVSVDAQQPKGPPSKMPLPAADPSPKRIITQGLARTVTEDLIPCAVNQPEMNVRKNPIGEIVAKDGTRLTVPTVNNFQTAPKLPDLYNECAGVTPKTLSEVDLNKVPIVELDKDGEVVTGFMIADNYFELYINGKPIGVDATPFTPFNSHLVRFRVKRPYTIAVLAQDWEDKLGLGMEVFRGNHWHSGDGGFVAKFSDGTVTNSTWKAQSFYIAPLQHPDDVVEYGNIHDTSHLGRIHPLAKLPTCRELCFAIHYPVPDGWMTPNFDDSKWPQAFEYLDEEVGITGVPGYWRYPEAFIGARWIWTINLVFDNTVLLRKTVR